MKMLGSTGGKLRFVTWPSLFVACASFIALLAVEIVIIASKTTTGKHKSLLIASAAINGIELVILGTVTAALLTLRPRHQLLFDRYRWAVCIAPVVATAAASGLTFAANALSDAPSALTAVVYAFGVLGLLSVLVSFLALYTFPAPAPAQRPSTADNGDNGSFPETELKESPRSNQTKDVSIDDGPRPAPTSGFYEDEPRRSSLRNSFQKIIHPIDSRSRLVHRASAQSVTTNHTEAQDSISHYGGDGFDTWEVDMDSHPMPLPAAAFVSPRLESIPASRPPSPAKPLDGPFPGHDGAEEAQDSHDDDHFIASAFVDRVIPRRSPPRSRSAEQMRGPYLTVRTTNTTDMQSHIHPLFRTDNPSPPPATSPGTIVTASAWGGQVVTSPVGAFAFGRPDSRTRPESPRLNFGTDREPLRSISANSFHGSGRPPLRSVKSAEPPTFAGIRANMPPPRSLSRQSSVAG